MLSWALLIAFHVLSMLELSFIKLLNLKLKNKDLKAQAQFNLKDFRKLLKEFRKVMKFKLKKNNKLKSLIFM